MNNFEFLKPVDKNLYDIISDAEKLYRDEYFEQCIGQTRRFGENICKNVLGKNRTTEKTFDDMLATLKDMAGEEQEKEFIEDLYFLKREGNASVHGISVKKEGVIALECLQRAFEIAISYALYRGNYDKKTNLLKLRYDAEMLVTGKKTKQTLAEKYAEKKARDSRAEVLNDCGKKSKKTAKKTVKQSYTMKVKEPRKSLFKNFVIISAIISAILCFAICILSVI